MRPHRLVLSTLLFACCCLSFGGLGLFAFEDGSIPTSKRCECDSVELWLSRRTNGAPKLFNYEDIASSDVLHLQPKASLGARGLRLWMPKHCELKLDDALVFQKNVGINNQNSTNRLAEIWIKDDNSKNCIAATVKCNLKSSCVGIETWTKDVIHFPQRKLLMYKTDNNGQTFAKKPYGILLSGLVLCSLIILVVLCGKAEKNSHDSVAHYSVGDGNVEIVSSEKIKRDQRDSNNEGVLEIIVESSGDLKTDTNSNGAQAPALDAAPHSVIAGGIEGQKDVGISSEDGVGFSKERRGEKRASSGSVEERRDNGKNEFEVENLEGKSEHGMKKDEIKRQKSRESDTHERKKDKRKEEKKKDVKDKEREKDMRSKRSHTAPEQKSSLPKTRFSLRGNSSKEARSSEASAYEEPKVVKREKKSSKKKTDNGSSQPSSSRAFVPENRRSFMNRELPKRPSEERDEPPPQARDSYADDAEEDDYETVTTTRSPPRSPARLDVLPQDDNISDTYDTVNDTTAKKAGPDPSADDAADMYETVETKKLKPQNSVIVNHTPSSNNPQFYESVLSEYEDPSVNRQRSFSERTSASSTPSIDAARKTMSLGRDAPSLPPRDLEFHEGAAQNDALMVFDDIEPYTITVKKGDRIIQETSISAYPRPSKHGEREGEEDGEERVEQSELSPEEKECLYTKVDKEKQKKDRMETEMGKTNEGAEIVGEVKTKGEAGATASVSADFVDEHQYEAVEKKAAVLEKKGSFEQTEDLSLYEEVVTKDDPKSAKVIAYV